ncbi:hypothetical protein [Actinophytocola sp.]|jgi:hypothetical protein|uniref:hypothetical protein n=1 Tax=Actinophytocola sp. TaxID=1872138 RepID=UPI002D74DB8C|nr:hypothetical protein [Actinophytocola sp.]HYQ64449.1 hypothetical protein [Actinophytocola sp.]
MQLAVARWTLDTFSVLLPTKENLNMRKLGGGELEQASFGGGEAERAFGGGELESGASAS